MSLDLLDAIKKLEDHFGSDSEIIVRSDNRGISVSTRILRPGEFTTAGFFLNKIEINNTPPVFNEIVNIKFDQSIKLLDEYINRKKDGI